MVAAKTNERPGTRARASHVRSSAYKAREVLDLIRGKSFGEARDELAFCERDVAHTINKVLASAVANAEHNEGLDSDDLYVSACYADEGPTLKRWRPRARGRATRIRKRTCHITVIVSAYDADTLESRRARQARRGVATAEARRRRVARSRAERQPRAAEPASADSDSEAQRSETDSQADERDAASADSATLAETSQGQQAEQTEVADGEVEGLGEAEEPEASDEDQSRESDEETSEGKDR